MSAPTREVWYCRDAFGNERILPLSEPCGGADSAEGCGPMLLVSKSALVLLRDEEGWDEGQIDVLVAGWLKNGVHNVRNRIVAALDGLAAASKEGKT